MQIFTKLKSSIFVRVIAVAIPVICLTVLLATTVFAQNTFVITDGEQVIVHTTYASDPAKVLSEAGFQLDADDFYTTQVTDGVSEITVQRAQQVTVNNCGQVIEASSYDETVEELLKRLGISTYGNYRVSEELDAEVYDGLQLNVDYVVRQTETYTVEVAYETTYCYDPTMAEGQERVISSGVAGQMLCSADVLYVNTVEQSRCSSLWIR